MKKVEKNKKLSKKVKILLFIFLPVLLIVFLLPSLISKNLIKKVIQKDYGFKVEKFEKFTIGPLLNSLKVKNLEFTVDNYSFLNKQTISLNSLNFKGLNFYNFYKLMQQEELTKTLTLIQDLKIEDFKIKDLENKNFNFNLNSLKINGLVIQPESEVEYLLKLKNKWPIFFNSAEVKFLSYTTLNNSFNFELMGLNVYNFQEDEIISFHLNGLDVNNNGNSLLEIDDLNVVNFNLNTIKNILKDNYNLIWLLQSSEFLNLTSLKADLSYLNNFLDYLYISEIKFDENRTANKISFSRIVKDLKIGVLEPKLKGEYEEFWKVFNKEIKLNLNLEASYNEAAKIFKIDNLFLNTADLFELNLNLKLNEVLPFKNNINKLFLLVSSASWVLKEGELAYIDKGFFKLQFYQVLKEHFYKDLNKQEINKKFQEDLRLFFNAIYEEEVIDNIKIIEKEVYIFLEDPQKFKINIKPLEDLALGTFANYDKYDIISALNLSIQVNERAPVFVVVNKNAQSKNIPTFPQPMEKLFETN